MDIPIGWRMDAKCRYVCICSQFRTDNILEVDSHMSKEFPGFCLRGLKCLSENTFECICGDKFLDKKDGKTTNTQAYNHLCDQMEKKIPVCLNRFRNKCQKCNLQLDSPSAFKLHIKTKSHLNFENKVDLHCKICDIHYRGQTEMLNHLKTKKHLKISLQQAV
jgi:hypothetical protein